MTCISKYYISTLTKKQNETKNCPLRRSCWVVGSCVSSQTATGCGPPWAVACGWGGAGSCVALHRSCFPFWLLRVHPQSHPTSSCSQAWWAVLHRSSSSLTSSTHKPPYEQRLIRLEGGASHVVLVSSLRAIACDASHEHPASRNSQAWVGAGEGGVALWPVIPSLGVWGG